MTQIHKLMIFVAALGVVTLLKVMSTNDFTLLAATQKPTNSSPNTGIRALLNTGDTLTSITHAESAYVTNIYQANTGSFYLEETPSTTELQGDLAKPKVFEVSPLLNSDFTLKVTGNIVRTRVTQTFANQSKHWRSGVYVFPLPEDAAVDSMLMQIGERTIEGQIKLKQEAEALYKAAKREGKSASLINQIRPNMFVNKVANIAPGSDITVTIEYQQVLDFDQPRFEVRIPSAITPRYTPISTKPELELAGSEIPTLVAPEISSAVSSYADLNIEVNIDMGLVLEDITSAHHQIHIEQKTQNTYSVKLSDTQAIANDFVLSWQLSTQEKPEAAHLSQYVGEYQYGLIQIVPPEQASSTARRNLTFILDTSGSMVGEAIEQAKQALKSALQELNETDTFNVIEFNSRAQALWQQSMPATSQHKKRASHFVSNLQASGGTEMSAALDLAFSLRSKEAKRNLNTPTNSDAHEDSPQSAEPVRIEQILFITDGSVANEAQLLALIKENLDNSRLFTVGIGSAPNTYFMNEAAIAGRGTYTLIGDVSQVEEKMTALLEKIKRPALSNITLQNHSSSSEIEYYPRIIPDVYAGEPLTITYRFKPSSLAESKPNARHKGQISIEADWHQTKQQANTKGPTPSPQKWVFSVNQGQNMPEAGIDKQWAYNKIRQLERSLHISPKEGEDYMSLKNYTKAAVSEIALKHHLVSQYTSLIAIDEQITRPSTEYLAMLASKQGSSDYRVKQWRAAQVTLPQTSTNLFLLLFAGGLAFISSMALFLLSRIRKLSCD